MYQTLETAGAVAVETFEIFGNNYLIIGNHFNDEDDVLFGYITFSTMYFWDRSPADGPKYVPIQKIQTFGASDVEIFRIENDYYLAVANYYNGTNFDISSQIYRFRYEEDSSGEGREEISVPHLDLVQSIKTFGARSFKYVELEFQQLIIVSNENNHSIDFYGWNGSSFEPKSSFAWESPGHIEKFFLPGFSASENREAFLAISSRSSSSVLLSVTSDGRVTFLSALPTGPATEMTYFRSQGANFLVSVLAPSNIVPEGGMAYFELIEVVSANSKKTLQVQLAATQASKSVGSILNYKMASREDNVVIAGSGWGEGRLNFTSLHPVTLVRQASRVGYVSLEDQTLLLSDVKDVLILRSPVLYNQSLSHLTIQIENFARRPVALPSSAGFKRGICISQKLYETAYISPSTLGLPGPVVWVGLNEVGSATLENVQAAAEPCGLVLLHATAIGLQGQTLRILSYPGPAFPALVTVNLSYPIPDQQNLSSAMLNILSISNKPKLTFLNVSIGSHSNYSFQIQYLGQFYAATVVIRDALARLNLSDENATTQIIPIHSARPSPGSYLVVQNFTNFHLISYRPFQIALAANDCNGQPIPFPLDGQRIIAKVRSSTSVSAVSLRNTFATAADGEILFPDLAVIGGDSNIEIEFSCFTECDLNPAYLRVNVSENIFQHRGPELHLEFWKGSSANVLSDGQIIIYGGVPPGSFIPKHRIVLVDPGSFNFTSRTPDWSAKHVPESKWTPPPRSGHAASAVNMSLFVHGGFRDTVVLAGFYRFDIASGSWTNLSNKAGEPSARVEHAMSILGNYVVLFGGHDGSRALSPDLYVYNLGSSSWSTLPAPPFFNRGSVTVPFSLVVMGSKVYVGESWEAYYTVDIPSATWLRFGPPPANSSASIQVALPPTAQTWLSVELKTAVGLDPRILVVLRPNHVVSSNSSTISRMSILALSVTGLSIIPLNEDSAAGNWSQNISIESAVHLAPGRVLLFGPDAENQRDAQATLTSTSPLLELAFDEDSEYASINFVMAYAPLDPPFIIWAVDSDKQRSVWAIEPLTVRVLAFDLNGNPVSLGGSVATADPSLETTVVFNDLRVLGASPGVVLVFTAPGLLSIATAPFVVNPGQGASVRAETLPVGVLPGMTFLFQPTASVVDIDGNIVWTDSFSSVEMSLQFFSPADSSWLPAGGNGSGLSGSTVAVSDMGYVKWTDLGIDSASAASSKAIVGPSSISYRLSFLRLGFDRTFSSNFSYTAAIDKALANSESRLVLSGYETLASGSAVSKMVWSVFTIKIVLRADPSLLFSADNSTIVSATLIHPQDGPVDGVLGGTLQVQATNGLAIFTDLNVDRVASGYRISFTSIGVLQEAVSDEFNIISAPAVYLTIETVASGGAADGEFALGGEVFRTQPVIVARDSAGNPTSSGGFLVVQVNLFLNGDEVSNFNADPNISAGLFNMPQDPESNTSTLSGHVAVAVSQDGKATFYDLAINRVGNYLLLFSAVRQGILLTRANQSITVHVGLPRLLLVIRQPNQAIAGVAFGVQPVITANDAGGNIVYSTAQLFVSAATMLISYSSSWLATNKIEDAERPTFESVSHMLDSAPGIMRNFLTPAGNVLVIVGHSGSIVDGGSELTIITIYKFHSGILTELESLPIPGASDFEYIPLAFDSQQGLEKGHLMVSCHYDEINGYQAPTRVFSFVFNTISNEFSMELVQILPTSGAVKLAVFEAAGQTFVAVACKDAGYEVTKVST